MRHYNDRRTLDTTLYPMECRDIGLVDCKPVLIAQAERTLTENTISLLETVGFIAERVNEEGI